MDVGRVASRADLSDFSAQSTDVQRSHPRLVSTKPAIQHLNYIYNQRGIRITYEINDI